jgi:hypothetical protein
LAILAAAPQIILFANFANTAPSTLANKRFAIAAFAEIAAKCRSDIDHYDDISDNCFLGVLCLSVVKYLCISLSSDD